jgi:hypothetical protein
VAVAVSAFAQMVTLNSVPEVPMPAVVDSNSPAYWYQGQLHLFNSNQVPVLSVGNDLFSESQLLTSTVDPSDHMPMWIESAWLDSDGTLYAWYHHEEGGVCPDSRLAMPSIGALVSYDGGATFQDLGIVIASTDPPNCDAQNGFFAGGTGDFSVILDQSGQYFYFLFDVYGGLADQQGVAIARMAFTDRQNPAGTVWRYFNGDWTETGIGGQDTPIFPATVNWTESDTDSFWGPSVHWNTHLNLYVVFMNRSCCSPNWPQKGIYYSYNLDLSDPQGWADPDKILDANEYYPQVIGLDAGGTDTLAGKVARFFVGGTSKWKITFLKPSDVIGASSTPLVGQPRPSQQ